MTAFRRYNQLNYITGAMMPPILFCSQCGSETSRKIPKYDDHPRFVCQTCDHIHYQNPNLVVGTLPTWEDRLLLCRRAIEPGYGLWTLPGGFMENDETVEQGAMRETFEECHADVELIAPYTIYSIPHINQVHMMFRANMRNSQFSGGKESLEVKLFHHSTIPWNEIAFRVVRTTIKHFVSDSEKGEYPLHIGTISRASER